MSWEPPFSTGTESAEPAGLRRLLRADPKRLLMPAVAAGVAAVLLAPDPESPPRRLPQVHTEPASPLDIPTSSPPGLAGSPVEQADGAPTDIAVTEGGRAHASGQTTYSIYLYKLPGLAPDARPGSLVDIWVTWKPPVTRTPKVDLLLEDVVLQRIETGFVEGAVADLIVHEDQVPDLIYGERFGSFNATVRAPSPG